ncbi:unnamed protein product [Schistosoma margrebowiei]|uniref:Uncharacterized protein n=1 Tax=Schistosoma margrebowiei TaxID=48269 RepID=A0AA85AHM0_9TREM|nr:unnamed protein product [Schistosoma margrebowiei]
MIIIEKLLIYGKLQTNKRLDATEEGLHRCIESIKSISCTYLLRQPAFNGLHSNMTKVTFYVSVFLSYNSFVIYTLQMYTENDFDTNAILSSSFCTTILNYACPLFNTSRFPMVIQH